MIKALIALALGLTLTGTAWAQDTKKEPVPVDPCVVAAQKVDKDKQAAALAKCAADAEAAKKAAAPKPAAPK